MNLQFSATPPKYTIHDRTGVQIDGYDSLVLAMEALRDAVWMAKADGVPSRHYLVHPDRETIVMQRG